MNRSIAVDKILTNDTQLFGQSSIRLQQEVPFLQSLYVINFHLHVHTGQSVRIQLHEKSLRPLSQNMLENVLVSNILSEHEHRYLQW